MRLIGMLMGFAESDPAILDLGADQAKAFQQSTTARFERSRILIRAQNLHFVNYVATLRRFRRQLAGRFTWITAWKTAFASALTNSGTHMAAYTAKPINIGLRPSGKSWRHRRLRSPASRPLKSGK
jgi:hypothetical protein